MQNLIHIQQLEIEWNNYDEVRNKSKGSKQSFHNIPDKNGNVDEQKQTYTLYHKEENTSKPNTKQKPRIQSLFSFFLFVDFLDKASKNLKNKNTANMHIHKQTRVILNFFIYLEPGYYK